MRDVVMSSPELQLIANCLRWPASEAEMEALRRASAQAIEWSTVLKNATRHQVIGLVHDGLRRAGVQVPSGVANAIQSKAAISLRENLALASEAAHLQSAFDNARLPVLFLKGASLEALAYGRLGLRSAKDIDLLVPYSSLQASQALLESTGYERADPPSDVSEKTMQLIMPLRKDLGYFNRSKGVYVELHWRLFLNPHAMDGSKLYEQSRIVPLTKSTGLRTLSEEDLFTYLCLHGARHWWYQLKWIADVGALLSTATDRLEQLYHASTQRGGGRAAAQGMLLCQAILETPLPSDLSKTLNNTPKVHWLKKTALKAITEDRHGSARRPFASTRGSLSVLLLSDGWRYRLAELKQILYNTADILTLPLPRPLWFLYPLLRLPLWLVRQINRKTMDAHADTAG